MIICSITLVYCVEMNLSINILYWRTPAFDKLQIDRGEDGNAFEERVVERVSHSYCYYCRATELPHAKAWFGRYI